MQEKGAFHRRSPSLFTVLLVSCAVFLPLEGVIDHYDLAGSSVPPAAFGDGSYGVGEYGVGAPLTVPLVTTTVPGSTTTNTTALAVNDSTSTATSTTLISATTAPRVEQASASPIPSRQREIRKPRPSLFDWVANPLGTFLDSRKEHLPDWLNAVAPPLRAAGFLWIPLLIGFALWLFLRYQHRIDANDPKLSDAPMYEEDARVKFDD